MITPDLILKGNRKSITLTVLKDGRVVVKAPTRVSDVLINKFIVDKQRWLASKLSLIAGTNEQFLDCMEYKKTLLYGEKLLIVFDDCKSINADFNSQKLVVPEKYQSKDYKAKIVSWYKAEAKRVLFERLKYISSKIKLTALNIKLTNAKGKWGSCSSKKEIALNWKMLMLPPDVIDYIIIHELCHLKEMNHSQNFWQTVESFLPHYKNSRSKLKKYNFVLELYR